jgi:serine/threonine protein kinase
MTPSVGPRPLQEHSKGCATMNSGLLDDFEVHEDQLIGKGETGILCRGRQLSEGRPVAIKLLGESVTASPGELLRCKQEAELIERAENDNVLRVIGSGVWKGRPFFALEDLEGEPLTHYLKDGYRFSTDEILHVGEGVARALQAASAAKIVHGAIRPSNLLLTSDGKVKVSGFGMKRSQEIPPESPTYLISLRYLSPEQSLGEPLDVRSDLYSLGVVLYELATGKPPFDGFDSATSLLYQISYVDPPSPRQRGALIPQELDRLILRCLEKSPANRSATPESFLAEIAAIRSSSQKMEAPSSSSDDLGDFEIFEDQVIGEGGMGTLYRGKQGTLGRAVAIKVIRGIFTDNPDCVQRFRREGELLAQVNDPSVVQVFGTGTWKGRLFYAMELVEGEDLASSMSKGRRYGPAEILDIAEGVARALKAAWEYRIVHRDIKPSNILISGDGRIKVADFGLAKSLRIPRTDSQLIAGTSEYLSPEQAIGQKVDIRSDLYSLGIVLYELVTGRTPFRWEGSFTGVIYQHVHNPPPPLFEMVPNVPPALAALIHRCLSKEAADRYPDPDSFIEELRRIRPQVGASSSGLPISSGIPFPRKLGRFCRRQRSTISLGAGLLALGGAAWILIPLLTRASPPAPTDPVARKTYALAMDLGDFPSALRAAERGFGRDSAEYRQAEVRYRDSRIFDLGKKAQALILAQDWEGAAAQYRILQEESKAPAREGFLHAEEYCRTLAEGRRLEREGHGEAALRIYRRLRAQGSLHESYLKERIDALEHPR